MPLAILRQLLLAVTSGTPWQYYEYALEETALAPRPSWRYTMAIVNRLVAQAVPVEQLRAPREAQYRQREYTHSEDAIDQMMAEFLAQKGGETNA